MRLIDADLLMYNLGFEDTEEEREENVGEIITWEDIDRLPTAFDMDKIIEELKDSAIEFETFGTCSDYVELSHAIDIVKRGGVDG